MTQAGRPAVEFYYCASCPWTYLAFVRLREAATRTGATIAFRPVVAEWIDGRASGPFGAALASANPRIAAYLDKDLADWNRFCGAGIRFPEPLSSGVEWAQRGAVVASGAGRGTPYVAGLFRAAFVEGRDTGDRSVVLEVASAAGLPLDDFERRLEDPGSLEAVRANTEELVRRGGFGSPTVFVGEDMYFGHERIPLVESALMHGTEQPFIAPGEHGR